MQQLVEPCIDHGFYTGLTKAGYKKVSYLGRQTYLHRAVLAKKLNKIEELLDTALHSCDNPRCINPNHLAEGTHNANIEDMVCKGRQAKGNSHGRHILTDSDCIYILNNWVFRHPELGTTAMAAKFGVGVSTVSKLLHSSKRCR